MTLPVAIVHVGAIIVPGRGGSGLMGWSTIKACSEGEEVHTCDTDTVNVYAPAGRSGMVVVAPDPFNVAPPGLTVTVQFADVGKPRNVTLPVEEIQVG